MFELGLRLAFDKPTIVIKDDRTDYSFDTSPLEHVGYPRDLRFASIVEFKSRLSEKIRATYRTSQSDPKYTTFLKHFGEFKVASIDQKEIGAQEFILEELREMRSIMRHLQFDSKRDIRRFDYKSDFELDFCLSGKNDKLGAVLHARIGEMSNRIPEIRKVGDHVHIIVNVENLPNSAKDNLRRKINMIIRNMDDGD